MPSWARTPGYERWVERTSITIPCPAWAGAPSRCVCPPAAATVQLGPNSDPRAARVALTVQSGPNGDPRPPRVATPDQLDRLDAALLCPRGRFALCRSTPTREGALRFVGAHNRLRDGIRL